MIKMAQAQGQGSTPSLAEIEPLLQEMSRVYHLGVHLEVPTEKLKQFERDYPRDTARQRTEVLTYWRDNCSDATWGSLAAAVEKVGGHGNLVRRLRELALESSRQHGDVAGDDVTFSTPPGSSVASDDSHTEDNDVFEHVSALPPVAAGSPVATGGPVVTGKLDESYLASATKKLKLDFTSLFTSVRLSLEKLQVTPESVLSHLKGIEAIGPKIETVYVSKSETFDKTLSKTIKSLEDLFPAIAPYCSWFNHLLVENIIETFCEDDERLLQKWEKYKGKFAKYCKSRLCQCPLDQFGEEHQHAETTPVVMKIDHEWKAVRIKQLEVIRDTVAQILNIKPYNLYLQAVQNGCIELTFYIPNFIATKCLPPSAEQIMAFQNEGISFIQYARVWALTIGDATKIDDLREVVMREVEVREKTAESAGKDVEIHQLQQELEHEQAERTRAEEQLQETRTQLLQKTRELEIKQTELQQAESQLEQKGRLSQKGEQVHRLESELTQTRAQVQQQAAELDSVEQSFQSLFAELEGRETRLKAQEEEIQQRNAEINTLMEELRKCQAGLQRQQKLLGELEDKEALLNPLEKELQRQIDELDGFMKEGSHLEKQSEKPLAVSATEESDSMLDFIKRMGKEKVERSAELHYLERLQSSERRLRDTEIYSELSEALHERLRVSYSPSPLQEGCGGVGAVGAEPSQWGKRQQIKETPLAELKIPLKLKWRKGKDMPLFTTGHLHAVVIGDDIYVVGGVSDGLGQIAATVMVYSVQTGSWRKLPPHMTYWFGMAAVNNQLVLVGGISTSTGKLANVLVAWDERSQRWTRPFPMMPTARLSPSAISYKNWLVVAGGKDKRNSPLNKVEILDTLLGQWYEGSPLPTECSSISSAINGNMWYLSGGGSSREANKCVFSVCLDELISQAVSQSAGSTSSPWQTLPEPPLTHSTVLILNGALLTVGGENSSSIHLYQPGRRSWVEVADLPEQQWRCACTVLPNGDMFVAGGCTGTSVFFDRVYIASIKGL